MSFDPTIFVAAGGTISVGTVLGVGFRILKVLSRLEQRLIEHDMMWFDYCEKHGIRLSPVQRRVNGGSRPLSN